MRAAARRLVTREAFADWRREPRHEAELVSQSVLGEIVREIGSRGEWVHVEARNGYRGWVRAWALERISAASARALESGPIVRAVVPHLPILSAPRRAADPIGEAGFLARAALLGRRGAYWKIALPGRGAGWLPRAGSERWEAARALSPRPAEAMIALGRRLTGIPYVWGGTGGRGFDCSGLALRLYEWSGLALPRDSRDQAALGIDFDSPADALPGDLLFFGARGRPVSHVAIAIGGGAILHASRSSVRCERLRDRRDLTALFRGGLRYPALGPEWPSRNPSGRNLDTLRGRPDTRAAPRDRAARSARNRRSRAVRSGGDRP